MTYLTTTTTPPITPTPGTNTTNTTPTIITTTASCSSCSSPAAPPSSQISPILQFVNASGSAEGGGPRVQQQQVSHTFCIAAADNCLAHLFYIDLSIKSSLKAESCSSWRLPRDLAHSGGVEGLDH